MELHERSAEGRLALNRESRLIKMRSKKLFARLRRGGDVQRCLGEWRQRNIRETLIKKQT